MQYIKSLILQSELDSALAKTCNNFDALHYEKLQTAYRYLGKIQVGLSLIECAIPVVVRVGQLMLMQSVM